MKFHNLNNLFYCRDRGMGSTRFVFEQRRTQYTPQGATAGVNEDDEEQKRIEEMDAQQRRELEHRHQLESKIAAASVSPETRRMMRECMAAGVGQRRFGAEDLYNAVERFLSGETREEEQFRREVDGVIREEQSWGTIFNTQR